MRYHIIWAVVVIVLRSWITSVGNERGRSWSRIGGTFRSACYPWRYDCLPSCSMILFCSFCSFFYSCYAFENPHINHHINLLCLSPLFQGLCYHYLGLSTNKAISFIKDILFFLFSTYILERKCLSIFALLPTCMYLILAVHLKTRWQCIIFMYPSCTWDSGYLMQTIFIMEDVQGVKEKDDDVSSCTWDSRYLMQNDLLWIKSFTVYDLAKGNLLQSQVYRQGKR